MTNASQILSDWQLKLESFLAADQHDWQIECLESVDSTMQRARELSLRSGALGLVQAKVQLQGKGRQGRSWGSPAGNLYVTIILSTRARLADLAGLSLVIGQAVREGIAQLSPIAASNLLLKWPNDIVGLDGRKAAGILIELHQKQDSCLAFVGIGINIQNTGEISAGRLALCELDHSEVFSDSESCLTLCAAIAPQIAAAWQSVQQGGLASFRESWLAQAYGRGAIWQIDLGAEQVSGEFVGLAEQGQLLLKTADGLRSVVAGHVLSIHYED